MYLFTFFEEEIMYLIFAVEKVLMYVAPFYINVQNLRIFRVRIFDSDSLSAYITSCHTYTFRLVDPNLG